MLAHPMRLALAALMFVLVGCPSSQDPGLTNGDGGMGDGGADAGVCPAVPSCTTTIKYKGAGTAVQLRGDFAADGWTAGVAMTKNGDTWEATVPVRDNQVIVYKFFVD